MLPSTARKVGAELAAKGVRHLAAPVLGGAGKCAEGTLTVVVSGDETAFREVRPEIEAISSAHHYAGSLGKASATKLMQNALGLVQTTAMVRTSAGRDSPRTNSLPGRPSSCPSLRSTPERKSK